MAEFFRGPSTCLTILDLGIRLGVYGRQSLVFGSSPHCRCSTLQLLCSSCRSLIPRTIMHRRPSAAAKSPAVSPLPPGQRDLSSFKSLGTPPHTPTKRAEPLPFFSPTRSRYSSDSWNSSTCDGANELVFDWTSEQVVLLTRVRLFGSCPPRARRQWRSM